MDRPLPSFAAAVALALALAAPAAAETPPAPREAPAAEPPAAAPPPEVGSPAELRDRRNLVLERELNDAFRDLRLEPRADAVPAFGFGLLAAGGATWVALETDARGTWAVLLGHLAATALTDAVIVGATPDPGRRCVGTFEALPGDTPEALAHRVAVGERCLEAAAQREASLRLTRAFRNVALGAATVALWGTEAPRNRDGTLLWIAGADGLFALFHLIPGEAERRFSSYREEALDVRLAPAPAVDTAGNLAPGLGLTLRI